MDIESYLVYGCALMISVISAWLAQRHEDKRLLMIAVMILTFVAGFRALSVGIDTSQYASQFRYLEAGRFDMVYALEKTYMYICYFLMQIFHNVHILFLLFAFITHYLVILRLWDFRDVALLPVSIACYFVLFYPESLNTMRQMVAVSIVFYGTRYIPQGKYFLFLLFIASAMLFHVTAAVGIVCLLTEYLSWNSLSKDRKKKLKFLACFFFAAGILILFKLSGSGRFKKYFTNVQFHFGLMLIGKFLFLLLSIVLMRKEMKELSVTLGSGSLVQRIYTLREYYGMGILMTSLGYIFRYANRIGWYCLIFESVYFGLIVKKGKYAKFFRLVIVLLIAITFFDKLIGGSNGEIPYRFFWQS